LKQNTYLCIPNNNLIYKSRLAPTIKKSKQYMQKPSIPKGTRDFSPEEMAKRNYIFNTIREVYHLYGFQQIETPAMENLSTLMGKYGEEGDKLLFKILNSGDCFSGITDEELLERNPVRFGVKACEKGLRYDLTVPFARYVVQHRNDITFPFKRYQIQPVWRADRPQKGRYREFYQCDGDVVGSDSLINEVELIQIMDEVFHRFGIRVCIKMNNRKILSGIAEIIGEADKIVDITVAIDKLDKIGLNNVNEELRSKGLSEEAIARLQPIIMLSGSNRERTVGNFRNSREGYRRNDLHPRPYRPAAYAFGTGTRPDTGPRSELLYRCHLRSKSAGCPDRKYHRWRTI
jgi:histidyl-tRNA synthetase